MKSIKVLIDIAFKKYKKAFSEYFHFVHSKIGIKPQIENVIYWAQSEGDKNFEESKGYLYDFFESQKVFVSVSPYDIKESKGKITNKWSFYIWVESTDIREGGFMSREQAELVAFEKAFQFVETKITIEHSKDRHYDESATSCNLRVNWGLLTKVLAEKRKLEANRF